MLLDQGVTWREIRQTLPHVDYRDGFESVKYGVDPGNCRVVFFQSFSFKPLWYHWDTSILSEYQQLWPENRFKALSSSLVFRSFSLL